MTRIPVSDTIRRMDATTETPTYVERIAKINNVKLGPEDHGIFTCMVDLDYGGSGQGAGGYALDEPSPKVGDRHRVGTAYGMEWIMRLMRAAGVDDFSKLKGRTILAIRDGDDYGARIVGLKPLPTEPGEPFLFNDLAARYEDA